MKKGLVSGAMITTASLLILGCQQPAEPVIESMTSTDTLSQDNALMTQSSLDTLSQESGAANATLAGYAMVDGKMMNVMSNGETGSMEKDATLSDDTSVMMDGKVLMKDGTTVMMKDGNLIDLNGKMMDMDDFLKLQSPATVVEAGSTVSTTTTKVKRTNY